MREDRTPRRLRPAGPGLLLALLALFGPAGCALFKGHLEAPKVTLQSVSPAEIGKGSQVFLVRLRLDNPNDQDLDVRGGEVTLDLADVAVGQGETTTPFVLPAYGTRDVDLRVSLDLASALPDLLRWMASGSTELDYTLRGHVDLDVTGLGRVPFKDKGKVKADTLLRQLPGLLKRTPRDAAKAPPAAAGAPGSTP